MEIFSVFATMSLVDAISAPLRAVQASMAATDKASASLGETMGRLAARMAPAGIAAGVFLGSLIPCVSAAADFEAQMSRVGAVSRASGVELAELTATARQLGAETEWSASQVAQAQEYLAMAGFTVQQNMDALPSVLNLASAAGTDLGRSADIASDILSGFGLEARETSRVADVLTATFTSSNTSLEMLGDTMKYVAPVAHTAGLSLEETAAMAGLLGNIGIKASQGGTVMRAMITRLAAPTSEAAKLFSSLGLSIADASGNMRNPVVLLGELAKATENLGSQKQIEALSTLFGQEAIAGVSALIEQEGTAGITKYTKLLTEGASASTRVAAQQNDNLRGSYKNLGSAFESVLITVGNLFIPVMRAAADAVTGVLRGFDALVQHPLGEAVLIVASGLAAGVTAFTLFTAAVWAGSVAMGALNAVMLANPVVLGLMAIAAAAVLLIAYWDEIAEALSPLQPLFSLIADAAGAVAYAFIGELGAAFLYIRDAASDVWQVISGSFAVLGEIITEVIGMLGIEGGAELSGWQRLGEVVGVIVGGAFRLLGAAVRVAVVPLQVISTAAKAAFDVLTGRVSALDAVRSVFAALGDGLMSMLVAPLQALTPMFMRLFSIDLAESGRKLIMTLVQGITSVISKPYDAVKSALTKVRQLLPFSDAKEGPLSALTQNGAKILQTMGQGAEQAAPALHRTIGDALAGAEAAAVRPVPVSFMAQPVSPLPEFSPVPYAPQKALSLPAVAAFPYQAGELSPVVQPEYTARATSELPPAPAPSFSAPEAASQSAGAKHGADNDHASRKASRGASRNVIIQQLTIQLPDVRDAQGFAEALQRLVAEYDGGLA